MYTPVDDGLCFSWGSLYEGSLSSMTKAITTVMLFSMACCSFCSLSALSAASEKLSRVGLTTHDSCVCIIVPANEQSSDISSGALHLSNARPAVSISCSNSSQSMCWTLVLQGTKYCLDTRYRGLESVWLRHCSPVLYSGQHLQPLTLMMFMLRWSIQQCRAACGRCAYLRLPSAMSPVWLTGEKA